MGGVPGQLCWRGGDERYPLTSTTVDSKVWRSADVMECSFCESKTKRKEVEREEIILGTQNLLTLTPALDHLAAPNHRRIIFLPTQSARHRFRTSQNY